MKALKGLAEPSLLALQQTRVSATPLLYIWTIALVLVLFGCHGQSISASYN